MGNGTENPYRTILAQAVKIGEMILNDGRDLHQLIRWLQVVIARKDFITLLDAPQTVQKTAQDVKAALLRLVGTVSVPAMPALGKVKDVFKVDTSETAEVKISYVDPTFLAWFGEMDIVDFAGSELRCQELTRDAYDRDIMRALGGENKAETGLSEIYGLMKQQSNGGDGILLPDGKANIFYVRDKKGTLRAVYVFRLGYGWYVYALEIDSDDRPQRARIFSQFPVSPRLLET